jgi:hypothetical protein
MVNKVFNDLKLCIFFRGIIGKNKDLRLMQDEESSTLPKKKEGRGEWSVHYVRTLGTVIF